MKIKHTSLVVLCILGLNSCTDKKDTLNDTSAEKITNKDSETKIGVDANIKVGEITFTKSLNNALNNVKVEGGKVIFDSKKGTDYFNNPDGASTSNSAPILLTGIDVTKPFTFTAKVTPEFTDNGTYTAGVVYLYQNDSLYQKLCFEQDERGKHRVVTVRTVETSDDNNHDVVDQPFVYMKISSDGKMIGNYYSLNNKDWQMVRLYQNSYPKGTMLGISSQSPKQEKNTTVFEEMKIEQKSISDFRLGN